MLIPLPMVTDLKIQKTGLVKVHSSTKPVLFLFNQASKRFAPFLP